MKKLIPIALIIIVAIWGFGAYNGLVTKDEDVEGKWAQVETSYQRRADLIPNLVETVKGYADFEQETLTGVIEARAKATQVTIDPSNLSPESIANYQQAQDGLSSALGRLLVSVERYPNLKADQQFLNLQAQLEGTENRINVARNRFNTSVQDYNTTVRKLPTSLIAGITGFDQKGYFEAAEGSDVAPQVDFGD